MSDQFTQFHYKLSKSSYCPDYEADDFDVKDIYVHSTLKVSTPLSVSLCPIVRKLIMLVSLALEKSDHSIHG